ncbi:hypothetical protein PATA110615_03195 [Paenibacillus taichungensis]
MPLLFYNFMTTLTPTLKKEAGSLLLVRSSFFSCIRLVIPSKYKNCYVNECSFSIRSSNTSQPASTSLYTSSKFPV